MKAKIIEALKTKFDGVKDEILDRIAGKAAKTIKSEEEVTTYVEGVTFQQVLDAYGDSRATDATKTAIANYEKKHGVKDGKPIEPEPEPKAEPEPKKGDDTPAWAKVLLERMDRLEGEKTANSRKAKLDELLKDAPEKIKARYEKDFARYNFKDDDDFSEWLEDSKTDIEAIKADYKAQGGVVTPPKGGGAAAKGVDPIVQARIDARAKATPAPSAIQG